MVSAVKLANAFVIHVMMVKTASWNAQAMVNASVVCVNVTHVTSESTVTLCAPAEGAVAIIHVLVLKAGEGHFATDRDVRVWQIVLVMEYATVGIIFVIVIPDGPEGIVIHRTAQENLIVMDAEHVLNRLEQLFVLTAQGTT